MKRIFSELKVCIQYQVDVIVSVGKSKNTLQISLKENVLRNTDPVAKWWQNM